jgi:hypothetical protein
MNIQFENIPPEGYVYLAVSVVVALFVDYAVVRFGLDFLKPATRSVFWLGRVGKLVSFTGWVLFLNNYWYGTYLEPGKPVPSMISAAEWAIVGLMLLFAFTTYPRASAVAQEKRGLRA